MLDYIEEISMKMNSKEYVQMQMSVKQQQSIKLQLWLSISFNQTSMLLISMSFNPSSGANFFTIFKSMFVNSFWCNNLKNCSRDRI